MKRLEWTETLSVGVEETDAQHRELHKAEHDRFASDLLALARDHERSGAGAFVSLRASHWLTRWLGEHVSGTDAELGRFLVKRTA
jgi:hemerythrin